MEKEISKRLFLLVLILIAALIILNSFNNFDNKNKLVSKTVISDLRAPSVTITSPDNFYTTNNPSLQVSGVASDNVNVREIRVWVNNEAWETASGTTSWSKVLNLVNGENVVYAQAFDTSDHASPVFANTFIYENLDQVAQPRNLYSPKPQGPPLPPG